MEENIMKGEVFWNTKGRNIIQERKPTFSGQVIQRVLMTACAIAGAVIIIGVMVTPLCAQPYPTKPIRLILPSAPGGATDIQGRIIAQKLAEQLGQPVVCDNYTHNAYEVMAKKSPDGYTLLLASPSMTIMPSIFKKPSFDPIKDFAPISKSAEIYNVLVIHPSLPINSLRELVEYAKANPKKLGFGSSGVGSPNHLAGELFKYLAKIDILHVPYKSAGQAMIGLLSGELGVVVSAVPAALPLIQSGKARALAVLSYERLRALPDVPTAKEAGIDNFQAVNLYGIVAPAGTPRNIINRLSAEWIRSAKMPDTIEKMRKAGIDAAASTPEQYLELLKEDVARWDKVAKQANISVD